MKVRIVVTISTTLFLCSLAAPNAAEDPAVRQLLDQVGIKPQGDQRGQMDVVGFASTAEQMNEVISQAAASAKEQKETLERRHGWNDETAFIAGICPHDDYVYAGRLYALLIPRIKARMVILFGVFHKARTFNCEDKLVFDAYKTWYGPYGPVPVSPLREEILQRLPDKYYVVNNDMQMVEHSTEAIVSWLQAYNRKVEIVSILIPYMNWETMELLASELSIALENIQNEKGWKLGEDVALICSADAVHYGDAGWGGSDFAEFGTDVPGYQMAVQRDVDMARNHLCGPINRDKLKNFLYTCTYEEDVKRYKITWCGRFSVPFGLNVASRLTEALEDRTLQGTLLDYGTSVSEASLNVEGIGVTAPNNLHHWVGYAAVGYR
jgi:AmmeMemoRadiSam system protein B